MRRIGRQGTLPDDQAALVRELARKVLQEKFLLNITAMADEIGISQPALSNIVGGREFKRHKANASEETALEIARLGGQPEYFWRPKLPAFVAGKQSGGVLRFKVQGEFAVELRSSPPNALGDAMRKLPHDRVRRGAIASIFAYAVPIEVAADAAMAVYNATDATVRDSPAFNAEWWTIQIGKVVAGKADVSGSFPTLQLIGERLESEPPRQARPSVTPKPASK